MVSGGIVNSARAQEAAKFTLSMGVSESVEMARKMIRDREEESDQRWLRSRPEPFVLPLPSLLITVSGAK